MKRESVFCVLLCVVLCTGVGSSFVYAGSRERLVTEVERQIAYADYVDLLNLYYFWGCSVMGVTGVMMGTYFLGGSAVWIPSGLVGCGLGLLAGPLGLVIHDVTVGDTTVKRYIRENLLR